MFRNFDTGLHLDFPNGWTVSVQWGRGNYCDNKMKHRPAEGWSSSTAEASAWRTNGGWGKGHYEENPRAYLSANEVMDYMDMIRNLNEEVMDS